MKKIALLLALVLLAGCLAGCGETEETEAPAEESAAVSLAGGWSVESCESSALPEAVQAAFDLACEGYDEMELTPIAYLGSQVVAGANYAVLCKGSDSSGSCPVVAIVYAALDGTAEFRCVNALDLGEYRYAESDGSLTNENMAGGWTVTDEDGAALSEEAAAAFDTAMEGLTGVGYTPLGVIGTQVVAGINYAYICRGTVVTANPIDTLKIVFVYAALDGSAEILAIADFDIADFNI